MLGNIAQRLPCLWARVANLNELPDNSFDQVGVRHANLQLPVNRNLAQPTLRCPAPAESAIVQFRKALFRARNPLYQYHLSMAHMTAGPRKLIG